MDRKYPGHEFENANQLEFNALSHDLKNLLHNILTGIDLLNDQQNKNGIHDKIITSIEKNAQLAIEILYQYESSLVKDQQSDVVIHFHLFQVNQHFGFF